MLNARNPVLRRALAVPALAAAMVGAFPAASYALGEVRAVNSQSSPLTVTGYGSTGKAYGTWRVLNTSNGTASRLNSELDMYHNADNHKVYATLNTQVNSGYCPTYSTYVTCTQKWFNYKSADTNHEANSGWHAHEVATGVSDSGDYARGLVHACLDIPYRPDPCTGWSYANGIDGY